MYATDKPPIDAMEAKPPAEAYLLIAPLPSGRQRDGHGHHCPPYGNDSSSVERRPQREARSNGSKPCALLQRRTGLESSPAMEIAAATLWVDQITAMLRKAARKFGADKA